MDASTDESRPTLDYAPAPRRRREPLPMAAAIAVGVDLLGIPVAYWVLPAPLNTLVMYVLLVSGTFFGLIVLVARRVDRTAGRVGRPVYVTFDEELIVCRQVEAGPTRTVRWADLERVLIETTSGGPFVEDVFWVLLGRPGGCVIPIAAAGIDPLVARLARLPGFDHSAVSEAMKCTTDRTFLCWKRAADPSP